MKRLIIAAMAAISMTTASYAITADEAIASKNWYVISDYCKTNNIDQFHFLFRSNTVDFATIKDIYYSATNINSSAKIEIKTGSYFNYPIEDTEQLVDNPYNKYVNYSLYARYIKNSNVKRFEWLSYSINNSDGKNHNLYVWEYSLLKLDMENSTLFSNSVELAIGADNALNNHALKDMLYPRLMDEGLKLKMNIAYNDVDKIIDSLLKYSDLSPEEANAIITPINAVDSEYRKEDILKALKNVNSKCTIKLYDDQKTWEPILAKIRAMISVRQ